MVGRCPAQSRAAAEQTTTALRSLLVYLHLEGETDRPLAGAVPSVTGWRLAGLPKGLEPGQVQALLASCDRSTVNGRRDFAILTMLARLGMRAGEVAALSLDDVNWRAGEITIRGKGDRRERLPLPADVGEVIAGYLHDRRSVAGERALFVRAANLTYYPAGEAVPDHAGLDHDWSELAYRSDGRGRPRVARMAYEIATFQALRDLLRCKKIWVAGAHRWRNPDEDLPRGP